MSENVGTMWRKSILLVIIISFVIGFFPFIKARIKNARINHYIYTDVKIIINIRLVFLFIKPFAFALINVANEIWIHN